MQDPSRTEAAELDGAPQARQRQSAPASEPYPNTAASAMNKMNKACSYGRTYAQPSNCRCAHSAVAVGASLMSLIRSSLAISRARTASAHR